MEDISAWAASALSIVMLFLGFVIGVSMGNNMTVSSHIPQNVTERGSGDLLSAYRFGTGFKKGQTLYPRQGAKVTTFDVIGSKVVVLEQNALAPHQYTVIGERQNPSTPSERFVKFEINGHDWTNQKSSGTFPADTR